MRTLLAGLALVISGSSAAAQSADIRALEACQARSAAFTEIAECLPEADVAVRALDTFDEIYPAEAMPLKEVCLDRNGENIAGALACVRRAVEQAIELQRSLPEGANLNDPVFEAVSDQSLGNRLFEAISQARSRYPERRIWGASTYYPYR